MKSGKIEKKKSKFYLNFWNKSYKNSDIFFAFFIVKKQLIYAPNNFSVWKLDLFFLTVIIPFPAVMNGSLFHLWLIFHLDNGDPQVLLLSSLRFNTSFVREFTSSTPYKYNFSFYIFIRISFIFQERTMSFILHTKKFFIFFKNFTVF